MLTDAGQFDEALAVTSLILKHYPKGPYRRDGQALAGDIKAARVRQWEQAHREATEQRRRRDADREQVRKVMKAPAAAFNTVLDNAKMIVETDTARELLLCLERFDHAERRLRHAAVDSFRETPNQPALLARVKEALPIVVTGDPRKLTPNGLEQREINGARLIAWHEFTSSERYQLYRIVSRSEAQERLHYWLYLFCIGQNLKNDAAVEFESLTSHKLRAEAREYGRYRQLFDELFDR